MQREQKKKGCAKKKEKARVDFFFWRDRPPPKGDSFDRREGSDPLVGDEGKKGKKGKKKEKKKGDKMAHEIVSARDGVGVVAPNDDVGGTTKFASQGREAPILWLPNELLLDLLAAIGSAADVARLGMTCRGLWEAIEDDAVWRILCTRLDPQMVQVATPERWQKTWRWFYRARTCYSPDHKGADVGTLVFADVRIVYHGQTLDGVPHGQGLMYAPTEPAFRRLVSDSATVAARRGAPSDSEREEKDKQSPPSAPTPPVPSIGDFVIVHREGNVFDGEWGGGVLLRGRATFALGCGGHYAGDIRWGLMHGRGVRHYHDGGVYEGEWTRGIRGGRGVHRESDGHVLDGMWLNDMLHGNCAIKMDSTGERYEGQMHAGQRCGRGTFTHAADEWTYEGEWDRDTFSGFGSMRHANGNWYEGFWDNGMRNGRGTMWCHSGSRYDGQWLNGCKHGRGTYTSFEGWIYVGEWRNDHMTGTGVIHYADGDRYEGHMLDGREHGRGRFESRCNQWSYEGDWVRGDFDGHGVMHYANGGRYEGQWHKDKRHGRGVHTCPKRGWTYEGEWIDDRKSGRGVHTFDNGDRLECTCVDNMAQGYGVYIYADGRSYKGEWRDDECHGYGTETFRRGRYEGQWDTGLMHGEGVAHYDNGDRYEGRWEGGLRHGDGVYTFAHKAATFRGTFCQEECHGTGVLTSACGASYAGQWRRGMREGAGVFCFADGARYESRWCENVPLGAGTLVLPTGERVECEAVPIDGVVNDVENGDTGGDGGGARFETRPRMSDTMTDTDWRVIRNGVARYRLFDCRPMASLGCSQVSPIGASLQVSGLGDNTNGVAVKGSAPTRTSLADVSGDCDDRRGNNAFGSAKARSRDRGEKDIGDLGRTKDATSTEWHSVDPSLVHDSDVKKEHADQRPRKRPRLVAPLDIAALPPPEMQVD